MDAITVCVDYSDFLAITLPRNRSKFQDYVIITRSDDYDTIARAKENNCTIVIDNEALDTKKWFNKGLAIERVLQLYRSDAIKSSDTWVAIMDADIVIPPDIWFNGSTIYQSPIHLDELETHQATDNKLSKHALYSPFRRHFAEVYDLSKVIELVDNYDEWKKCDLYPDREFAGYLQIFNTGASCLREKIDWYPPKGWEHAGGCDSFFERHFAEKVRITNWEVLHLGHSCLNWCGRISPYIDGREDVPADVIKERQDRMINRRRRL